MDVWDFGSGTEISATDLLIDGEVVDAGIDGNPKRVHIVYDPPRPLSGVIEVGLRSRDRALPMNRVDRVVMTFQVTGSELDGDLDSSGRVDGVDLVMFARAFGATPAEIRYLPDADFNRDDVIDGEDLAVLASNFGQSSL
jgi:hypothetical protein